MDLTLETYLMEVSMGGNILPHKQERRWELSLTSQRFPILGDIPLIWKT